MTVLEFVLALICIATSLSAIMAAAWLAWRRTGNSGWVDMIWTFGLGTVGCVSALAPAMFSGAITARQGLVALLVIVWSLRLGLHIARRTAGIADDPRYAKLIRDWGADAPGGMFRLLQKQALVSIPLALSILLAAWNPLPGLRVQDVLGVIVLMTGIVGEAVADAQLRRFRADPARTASATSACGDGRGIRTTSSNGWDGSPIRCSRSISPEPIRGVGSRLQVLPACIGCWCTFRASRRWRRTCWSGAGTNFAPIRPAPTPSSRRRRGPS